MEINKFVVEYGGKHLICLFAACVVCSLNVLEDASAYPFSWMNLNGNCKVVYCVN